MNAALTGLRLSTLADGDTLRVFAEGELDMSNADQLDGAVRRSVDPCRSVALDLAGITFIDSSGLSILIRLKALAEGASKRLIVERASDVVARLLGVAGLLDFFDFGDAPACPVCGRPVPGGTLATCPRCGARL